MVKKWIKQGLKAVFNASAPLFSKKSDMDEKKAREILTACSPPPAGVARAENRVVEPVCDLQIVIPAYNVAEFLEGCMDSVLSQKTKYDFRVVLVDDGSTDETPKIADRYRANPRVRVIHQENRGFSGARNVAMEVLFARYIMFVDSDDLLHPGAIEALLDAAYANDCDVAEGGAYYLTGEEQTLMYRHDKAEMVDAAQTFHGQPWGKVYRTELFRNLRFPEGFWYEDSILAFLVWPVVKRTCTVTEMAYIHRRNPKGITASSQGRPKAVDTYWITEALAQERQTLGLPADEAYFAQLLDQIRLNHYRVRQLSEDAQEAVFVLSCELMARTFGENWPESGEKTLVSALKNRDFGAYRMCCKLY